ncbi:MAG: OsmC family protein [Winogradskyella sp.]|nr:OsmC family protein [Winogradskyella sp.]
MDKITTHWKGNMVFESDNPRWPSIMMDASEEFGGTGKGMAPKAMMLSSLAGCSGLDVISTLDKMKEEIDDFKIEVSGELTTEHPKYYHTVRVDYHFYGSNLNKNKCKRAVNLSVDKYCGVMEMFRQFAKVETNIIYHIGTKHPA